MEPLTLPLLVIASLQVLLTSLLLLPVKSISLLVSNYICKGCRSELSRPVLATVSVLLLMLFGSGVVEILRGSKRVNMIGEVDHLRAQVTCLLSLLNLLLLLLNQSLAFEKRLHHLCSQNLEAMKRQVKGLQTEYERVTSVEGAGKAAADGSTADPLPSPASADYAALKKHVDKLIMDKIQMQNEVDAARKEKANAEAKGDALLSQIKGFDKEYDRVLDENKALTAKLAGGAGTGGGSGEMFGRGGYSHGKAE